MAKTARYYFSLLLCFLSGMSAFAQADASKVSQAFDNYRNKALQEKVYVHTDRTVYATGDYLWLKIYCVEGYQHKPLPMSKVAYVEVLDHNQTPVLQARVGLTEGIGHTALFIPASLNTGNYTLRAYTRWMMNFSPDFYFNKTITVINPFKQQEPVTADPKTESQYDIQFFPEGGDLVARLASKVAFRMVDKNGLGIARKGFILDQRNDTITTFEPLKFGLGHFSFTPQSNASYRALILESGGFVTRPLPAVLARGYVMKLTEEEDNIQITVSSTELHAQVQLLAHTRNEVAFDAVQPLKDGTTVFKINKDLLEDGISHLTVFNDKQPVCERLFYKPLKRKFELSGETDKNEYATRSRVNLSIAANANENISLETDLSVSVYRLDSLQHEDPMDIKNYLMLTSELPGTVESPAFYFSNDPNSAEAMDNLMLTHGWRRFKWQDVTDEKYTYHYFPEYRGSLITGRVEHIETGEPAKNVMTYLSVPGKKFDLRASRSNGDGEIKFELTDFYWPSRVVVQTNPLIDSTYRIRITNPFSTQYGKVRSNRFVISSSHGSQVLTRSINMQLGNTYHEKTRSIKVLPVADSIPFYGKPDERYYLDEYTRFPFMEDVMREYVPGVFVRKRKGNFSFLVSNKNDNTIFNESPLVLLDGVPVFSTNKIMSYSPLNVQRLDVVTHRYFYGPLEFQGIVSYTTYRGEMQNFQLDSRVLIKDQEGIQCQRQFFSPVYETTAQQVSRTPDFRDLLFWSPSVKTNEQGKANLSFYTSDQPGDYLVNIQGLTKDGEQASTAFTISVATPKNN